MPTSFFFLDDSLPIMSKFAAIGDKFSFINKVTEILLLLY